MWLLCSSRSLRYEALTFIAGSLVRGIEEAISANGRACFTYM
jgi:hypothetical protein